RNRGQRSQEHLAGQARPQMFQAVLHKWWRMLAKAASNCKWNAERGVTTAGLHCPCHLYPRLTRQAAEPDPSHRGVEVGPGFAVHLDGGNRGGGGMTQDQHHLTRGAPRWQGYPGLEAAMFHVGY